MTRDQQRALIIAAFTALPRDTWWGYADLADVALNALGIEPHADVQPRTGAGATMGACRGRPPDPDPAATDPNTARPASNTWPHSEPPAPDSAPNASASNDPA